MRMIRGKMALVIACVLFVTACTSKETINENMTNNPSEIPTENVVVTDSLADSAFERKEAVSVSDFYGMDDPEFLNYVRNNIGFELSDQNEYKVEDVQVSYISYDYLEELQYNSKKNIYFGYTLEEIEEQFQEEKYVFTLGEDGTTVVKPFEEYDDTFERVIHNFAVGTGFVLIKLTVKFIKASVTGGPAGATEVLFAVATETFHDLIDEFRSGGGIINILKIAVERWDETKDWEETLKVAALQLSEQYKWAAIKGLKKGIL